jgi:Flp pilus assembly protein TadD
MREVRRGQNSRRGRGGTRFASARGNMASRRLLQVSPDLPLDQRVAQALKFQRRGDARKAMLILRELCFREASNPRLWTLYAVQCWRMGRRHDACQALRQALWFRERERDEARARVVRALLNAAETSDEEFLRAA